MDDTETDLLAPDPGRYFTAWRASLCGSRGLRIVGPSRQQPDDFAVVDVMTLHRMNLCIAGYCEPGDSAHGRFKDVVHLLARLRHPHLWAVFDAGVHEHWAYLLMEPFAGRNLKERIRDQPLTVAEAVELIIGLADTMEFMHREGVDNLDLITSGVLYSEDGDFRINPRRTLDRRVFGPVEADEWVIHGGITGCEAPELMGGQVSPSGREADVYALGAVLFELLTGRAALIRGEVGLRAIRNILDRDPELPRSLNKRVDRALESICLRCLAKDPARRFGSAASLAGELKLWRASAERTGLTDQLWHRFLAGVRRLTP
jgi:eukaryotic-like serine/threonine-protein kinase